MNQSRILEIAHEIESNGRTIIGETFYSSDEIINGEIASAIIEIISVLYPDKQDYSDLSQQCESIGEKRMKDLMDEEIEDIVSNYRRLLRNKREAN